MKRWCNPYLSSITKKKMLYVYIHHAVITVYILKLTKCKRMIDKAVA